MAYDRPHLFSFKLASALRDSFLKPHYRWSSFGQDCIAGLTVGIISIPLAMALAIASGVAPEHGLYTAMIAGLVIALLGGARYSISGPTAAFVVILYPVTQQFGLTGLLIATFLAGCILVLMALARLGRLIEYIPEPVTLGFTGGIAIVIAVLQFKDFLGLNIQTLPGPFIEKSLTLIHALPTFHWGNALVGSSTLAVLILWPRLRLKFPAHLPAVLIGVLVTTILTQQGQSIDTIGSRFSYQFSDGTQIAGIPPIFPSFSLPWSGVELNWALFRALLPSAFSIAMLGAIESLLCAVILDRMSNTKHYSNTELFAQGVGNMVVPFFGGITATAALARSVANYRAGAQSPLAGVVHAGVILLAILILAPVLAYLPMASMAALLLMVAWNMGEPHKIIDLIKKAPYSDVLVLILCLLLTVLLDMVTAIGFGIVLAALLFMRHMSEMTHLSDISHQHKYIKLALPQGWSAYRIQGPLFFASVDKIFSELKEHTHKSSGIILDFEAVSILDAAGLLAFTKFLDESLAQGLRIIVADLQFQPLKTLAKAKVQPIPEKLLFTSTLTEATERARFFQTL